MTVFKTENRGFTLAELLIALTIMAEIATFTIPKVLTASANQGSNAKAREALSMVANAYQAYGMSNKVTAGFRSPNLTPYMNYVNVQTTGLIDDIPNAPSDNRDCANTTQYICLKLYSGAVLWMERPVTFGGTNTTNALIYFVDPDGVPSGSTSDGPGKSVGFLLYFTGRVTSGSNIVPGSASSIVTYGGPWTDPSWFHW